MHPNDSAWQAFRVSLLSPLITGEILHEDREAYFQKLTEKKGQEKKGQAQLRCVRDSSRIIAHN